MSEFQATGSLLIEEASVSDLDFLDDYVEAHMHAPRGVQFSLNVEAPGTEEGVALRGSVRQPRACSIGRPEAEKQ